MRSHITYLLLFSLLYINKYNAQHPLYDSLDRRCHIPDLIDSLHFSPKVLKEHFVKQLKIKVKEDYYSRDNDSLYLMTIEDYNRDGYTTKKTENTFDNKSTTYEYELDQNNQVLKTHETIKGNKILIGQKVYDGNRIKSDSIRFTINTDKVTNYFYDNSHRLVETWEYCYDVKEVCRKIKNQYDDQNRLIGKMYFQKDNSLSGFSFFTYDSLSRLEKIVDNYDSLTYNYSTDGLSLKVIVKGFNDKMNYKQLTFYKQQWKIEEYEHKKVVKISVLNFNKSGQLIDYTREWPGRKKRKKNMFCGYNPPSYSKTTLEYNAQGKLVCKKEFSSRSHCYSKVIYEYYDNGLLAKETEYDDGKLDDIWFYEYSYW